MRARGVARRGSRQRPLRAGAVQVSEVQRARILTAMVRVVAEHGAGSATVARVVARAGVSRRTFYEQFTGCEDCFLAVFEDTITRASRIVSEATADAPPAWREQVRAGLATLLAFFDEEPTLGSLLVVDALGAGPEVLEYRARLLEKLTAIVEQGRRGTDAKRGTSSSSPRLTAEGTVGAVLAEGTVGAVLSVIHARMLEQRAAERSTNGSGRARQAPGPLLGLLNPLMGMIVLPYLGQAAATKELARPVPNNPRRPRQASGNDITASAHRARGETGPHDPLEGLNMRLTFRTLVVLSAIAHDPGASNRRIADAADIHDQGQISKLLTRLQRLGLVENTGNGHTHGEPNAWTLTPRGTEVQRVLADGR
jgi:AcrR family transcriptional regulator/DNA-binding MarR family transcriptional regulator